MDIILTFKCHVMTMDLPCEPTRKGTPGSYMSCGQESITIYNLQETSTKKVKNTISCVSDMMKETIQCKKQEQKVHQNYNLTS